MDSLSLTHVLTLGLGALIGLALALTGAGGGILAMPLLILVLHLTVVQAAPIALLAVGLSAALGALLAFRQRQLRYRAAALIGGVGVLVAPSGTWLAHQIPVLPMTLVFAAVLAAVAIRMIREAAPGAAAITPDRSLPCVQDGDRGRLQWTAPCARALIGTGALSGLLSGALGVGGGFVIVPALARYTNLTARSVVGTSLAVIALVSAGSVTVAALSGHLLWPLALPFAGGAALGTAAGSRLAGRIAPGRLKQAFGLLSLLAAAIMVQRAWAS
ncbi:sulfite exporter TauE/SafE family protein [Nevskia sp.]|uniref:sulfite exporter TauE/SafE family protein n=1 Tax=Nevskia sp. TaxID=1929292 RepID=UPI003F6FD37F